MIGQVEEWYSRGHVLHQGTASELRGIVRDAIVRRCLWNDPLMPEPTSEVLRSACQPDRPWYPSKARPRRTGPGTADAPIKFSRGAANSVFFQGLLRAQAGKVPGAAELGPAPVRDRRSPSRQPSGEVFSASSRTADQDLLTGLRASLIGAALAGQAWPGMDEAALLAAALDDGRTWARADAAMRTSAWQSTLDRHREARRELVSGTALRVRHQPWRTRWRPDDRRGPGPAPAAHRRRVMGMANTRIQNWPPGSRRPWPGSPNGTTWSTRRSPC